MSLIVKFSIFFTVMLALVFVILNGDKTQGETGKNAAEKSVEEEIIAIEEAALDRWGKGDPWGFVENAATEFTYFDPGLERRLDGLENFRKDMASIEGKIKIIRHEMINPKVQVHGDTAVLTFNLIDIIPTTGDSTRENRWNSTEVFIRVKGQWQRIHSHWSKTKPPKLQ